MFDFLVSAVLCGSLVVQLCRVAQWQSNIWLFPVLWCPDILTTRPIRTGYHQEAKHFNLCHYRWLPLLPFFHSVECSPATPSGTDPFGALGYVTAQVETLLFFLFFSLFFF